MECSEVECLKKELSGEERIIYLQLDETISVEKIENNFMIEKRKKFAGKYSVPYAIFILSSER